MQAVLFDLFGTLDPNLSPRKSHAVTSRMAALYGLPATPFQEAVKGHFPHRMDGTIPDGPDQFAPVCAALGVHPQRGHHDAAYALWHAFQTAGLTPKHDAVSTLTAIRDHGLGRQPDRRPVRQLRGRRRRSPGHRAAADSGSVLRGAGALVRVCDPS